MIGKNIELKAVILFIIIPSFCFGHMRSETGWFISPGVSYQKQFMGELNIMYGTHFEIGIVGTKIGIETNFDFDHFVFAPKIGGELSFLPISLRASSLAYTNGKGQWDWRLLPEVGLSFLGGINLSYGYGIPLLKERMPNVGGHRISLVLNIFTKDPFFFR